MNTLIKTELFENIAKEKTEQIKARYIIGRIKREEEATIEEEVEE